MDEELRYLGGLWVMFEFPNKQPPTIFQNHEGIWMLFLDTRLWSRVFVVPHRPMIDIEGVPLKSWSKPFFVKYC